MGRQYSAYDDDMGVTWPTIISWIVGTQSMVSSGRYSDYEYSIVGNLVLGPR